MLKTSKVRGFTLVELMITIALLAIILSLAVPNMGFFVKKRALRSTFDELRLSLAYARSEAVKQGKDIYVLPATGGWALGWCVTESSSSCDPSNDDPSNDQLLRTFTPHSKTITFSDGLNPNTCDAFPSNGIKFTKKGTTSNTLKLMIQDSSIDTQLFIEVSRTGRTSSTPCS